MQDTCSYCKEIHNASIYNDMDALKKYYSFCCKSIDSSFFDKKYNLCVKEKARYVGVQYYDIYQKLILGRILDLNIKDMQSQKIQMVNYGNIIGIFRIEKSDTIYEKLLGLEYLPKFSKSNKDYFSFIESKLIYPEDKGLAFNIYNTNILTVYILGTVDKNGNLVKIKFDSSSPLVLNDRYKEEALRVVKETSGLIVPAELLGKKVCCEVLFPVNFELKETNINNIEHIRN